MDRNLRIRVMLDAIDKASKPLEAIDAAAKAAAAGVRAAQAEVRSIEKVTARVDGFRKLKRQSGETAAAMEAAQAKVAALTRTMPAAEQRTRAMNAEMRRAVTEARTLSARHETETRQLQQMRDGLAAAGVSTRNLAEAQRDLRARALDAAAALEREQQTLEQVQERAARMAAARTRAGDLSNAAGQMMGGGASMVVAGAAAVAPLVQASRAAMTLEDGMADIGKVLDKSLPQLDGMRDHILDMSTRIPIAAEGMAQIAAAGARAQVGRGSRDQQGELLAFVEDAAKMGIAFDVAADQAGETMAKWRTSFNLGRDGVVALADQVNALTNAFGGNAASVVDIVTRIGPLGKVAGLAAPQIAAMGATLDAVGVEAEVAATGIKNTMLALTKGEAATKSQKEAFGALGLEASAVAKRMQQDAAGTITDVMKRLSALPKDRQSGLMTDLFGSESVAAIAPMLTNLDQLQERLALVGDKSRYAGSMNAEYLARIATTSGATGLAGNALSALNVTLGQQLLPTIVGVAQWVTGLANDLRSWAQAHPTLAKWIAFVAAGLGGMMIVMGGLMVAIGAVLAPLSALTIIAATFGLTLAGLMLPILAWIAAIAGVIAIGAALYNHWASIDALLTGIFTGIVANFMAMVAQAKTLWSGFVTDMKTLGRYLMDGLLSMLSPARLVERISSMARSAVGAFKSVLGIHSPSRVFAELGGHVVSGLNRGLDARASTSIDRMKALAGRMTTAMAIGTAVPSIAAAGGPGAGGTALPAAAAAPASITINIYAQPGQDARSIAEEVRRQLDEARRAETARAASRFADIPDWRD